MNLNSLSTTSKGINWYKLDNIKKKIFTYLTYTVFNQQILFKKFSLNDNKIK